MPENNLNGTNLDFLKIVDLKGYIELVIISKRYIKKGEKINLNNKNIFIL
jgi:hypothetical protein